MGSAVPTMEEEALAAITASLKLTLAQLQKTTLTNRSTPGVGHAGDRVHNMRDHMITHGVSPSEISGPFRSVATAASVSFVQGEPELESAHQLFDGIPGRPAVTTSHVLDVTVTHVLYPVTEKVLGQVFDPDGVNEICVVQQTAHVKAFVEFQSWREASKARGALHGRCIYDDCCHLNIQYASPSVIIIAPTPSITFDNNSLRPGTSELGLVEAPQPAPMLAVMHPVSSSLGRQNMDDVISLSRTQVVGAAHRVIGPLHDKEDIELTHVGGSSLLMEFCSDSADEIIIVVDSNPLKHSVWDEKILDDVVTHVGGISLFLELCGKPIADGYEEMLTHIGGVSLFLEPCVEPAKEEGLGSADEVFHAVLPEDVYVPYVVLTHVGGLSLFLEFGQDQSVACTNEVWHDKSPWFCSTFSPGNIATVIRLEEIWVCQLALNEDSVYIMKILDELHTSSWFTSSTEHVHIMVSLLSRRISLALHILVSSLEKVTISAARLWDPGIFQVGFLANLQLLECYWVPYIFVSAIPWVGSFTHDGVSLGIDGLDGAFFVFGTVHSWRQKAFSHRRNIMQSLNFVMDKWSPWNRSGFRTGQRQRGSCYSRIFGSDFMLLFQYVDPGGWQVTLVHSLGTLKLIISTHLVLDIMLRWRRGSFSPGARVCTLYLPGQTNWTI